MRLHQLRVQAFGPFTQPQHVDFDALAECGLFLLHGPTGAGKTSVLDAVCFALYGRVPGVRNNTRLRSDHAPPELAPQVVCEFSVGARRFEVTRSPAWERAKRRGSGTTTEQSRVLLREAAGTGWRTLTQRIDEAAHLLDGVLGLSLDQFTKLVLLAQGEFAAFLRADAEARREMLERLFDTQRFTQVQRWLGEHQLQLKHRADACDRTTRDLLAGARQAAAVLPVMEPAAPEPVPGLPVQEALPLVTPEPTARQVLDELHTRAVQAWEAAGARREVARKRAARTRRSHDRIDQLAARQREHADLTRRLAELEGAASASAQAERRRRLRAADQTAVVATLAPQVHTARERSVEADAQAQRLANEVCRLAGPAEGQRLVDSDDGQLADHLGTLSEHLGQLEELGSWRARLGELADAARAQEVRAVAAGRAFAEAGDRHAQLTGQLVRAQQEQAAAVGAVESLPALLRAQRQSGEVVAAVSTRDRLTPLVAQATAARDTARAEQLDARDHTLDLRERRLAGMAAELAGRLVEDEPCPVCGSPDHPAPTAAGPGSVTEAQERAALARLRRAESALENAEAGLRALAEELAAVAGLAGTRTAAEAIREHERAGAALATARATGERHRQLGVLIEQAQAELTRLTELMTAAGATAEAERQRQADLRGRYDELAAQLAEALAQGHLPDEGAEEGAIGERVAGLRDLVGAVRGYQEARRAAATAREQCERSLRAASVAAAEAGFDTLEAALGCVLPDHDRAELLAAADAHDGELAAIRTRLRARELVDAATRPAADAEAAAAAFELAAADEEATTRELALCEQAVQSLTQLRDQLSGHLIEAEPVLREYRRAAELARCAEGTGGDNALKMSLSAFVLAARLEQVAQAASQRLLQMSGGRYALTHTDAVQRGRRRSGLGLLVLDGWTGQTRDTASLSGGETFYTSLALALGLADVVSAEAGGITIETLFVDEGFGTLDEQALQDVMDVLDGLRAGGRTVGLVSHVADLRERIPAQLEVVRGRAGSTLHLSGVAHPLSA